MALGQRHAMDPSLKHLTKAFSAHCLRDFPIGWPNDARWASPRG